MHRLGLIVAIVVAAVDVMYVWYVGFVQGATSDLPWRVPFVASYLAAVAICAMLSATVAARSLRVVLLGAAAGGLLLLGFFAIFSIGLPLVVAGLLTVVALVRAISGETGGGRALGASIAGALAAMVVLLAGFAITERIIGCAPGVVSGSGGGGLFSGPYSYACQNGRANVTYGR